MEKISAITTQLRFLLENGFNIGLDSYPIFNEDYRYYLNKHIVNYYYYDEIGVETPARFKRLLNNKMEIIMPKYNLMYKNKFEELNPYTNYTMNEIIKSLNNVSNYSNGNSTDTNTTNATTITKNNIFEVGSERMPDGILLRKDIENNLYASNAQIGDNKSESKGDTKNTGNTVSSASSNEVGNKIENRVVDGYTGKSLGEIVNEFYTLFTPIDQAIINELAELFMGVYYVSY